MYDILAKTTKYHTWHDKIVKIARDAMTLELTDMVKDSREQLYAIKDYIKRPPKLGKHGDGFKQHMLMFDAYDMASMTKSKNPKMFRTDLQFVEEVDHNPFLLTYLCKRIDWHLAKQKKAKDVNGTFS